MVTLTVTDFVMLPPLPVHASVKVWLLLSAPLDALPEVAFVPDHPPEAVQAVVFVEDHVSVALPPLATLVGVAVKTSVGAVRILMVTLFVILPPPPVQVSEKALAIVSAPLDSLPDVAFMPDQAPDALQAVALVADQLRVAASPAATLVGAAVRLSVGAGRILTVAFFVTLPPAPVHVSEKLLAVVSAPLDWLPDVALVPDQAPEALQLVASVADQTRFDAEPLATLVGLALKLRVGRGGGGGACWTVTVTVWVALPPAPVQVKE